MTPSLPQLVTDAANQGPRSARAAGRLMSVLENEPHRLPELLHAIPPQAEDAAALAPRLMLGVTGAPGSGKSTLTDVLVREYRQRWPDRKVGVIAVDPSSPFSGGAVLGDRVRMMRHATDPMVYVRSMATRGHLGGLSLGVKGVIRVMALIGCDTVFIETVGVGQSEVEVARVADKVLIVLAPGQGDSIQLLKAGLMEVGDLFVVNKADREGADELYRQLMAALKLAAGEVPSKDMNCNLADLTYNARRDARVALVSAAEGRGVPELVDLIESGIDPQRIAARRQRAVVDDVREAILEEARRRLLGTLGHNGTLGEHVQRVLAGETTVEALAQDLLQRTAAEAAPSEASKDGPP